MSVPEEAPVEPFEADVFARGCPSRQVLQHLTGRWGVLAIAALRLGDGALRFGEIRRRIDGISDRMLSQTLSQLEHDGMVHRTVRSGIPPHVDYALTPLGAKLAEPLLALIDTLEAELPQVLEAHKAQTLR
ncbi:helix-turn-helix domain-containing protein [Tessaracoccus terricola]